MDVEEVLVREALRRLEHYRNWREKSRQICGDETMEATMRRWHAAIENGDPIKPFRGDTRPRLDRFLGLDGLPFEEARARIEEFRAAASRRRSEGGRAPGAKAARAGKAKADRKRGQKRAGGE